MTQQPVVTDGAGGSDLDATVARIRAFNRGWTEVLGLLDQGLLDTPHTLAEARVVFELAQQPTWERAELRDRLGMDASFLTRVVGRLESDGLVAVTPSDADGRALRLSLTDAGRAAFAVLDQRSAAQITSLLQPLSNGRRADLAESMATVGGLIRPDRRGRDVRYRQMQPGDMGWVIQRHGAVYWDEFRWEPDFEALVARIVADYHDAFRPGRERAWIAELDGARVGCVFCCQRDPDTAQLRLLLVEPWARGLRIGDAFVERCIAFARDAGYDRMMLWTNDVLIAARRIYERFGFRLVASEPHHSFGHDLVGEDWQLMLDQKS